MEDYNASEFRVLLEVDLHYMVDSELRDYSVLLLDRCALLDEAGKRDHLESERRDALKYPALNTLLTLKPFLSIQLDEIAASVTYWKVYTAASNLDAFFSKVPFLRSVIDGMLIEAKVKYLTDLLAPESKNAKPGRQPNPPRTFQYCFKNTESMERLLSAALSVGLIARDGEGYIWPDDTLKSHRVCALWSAAVDAGLVRSKLKNNEATVKALGVFFKCHWSKDTIEECNQYSKEFKRVKALIVNKLRPG